MLRSATVRANVDEKTEDTMIQNATAELVKTRVEAALLRSENHLFYKTTSVQLPQIGGKPCG